MIFYLYSCTLGVTYRYVHVYKPTIHVLLFLGCAKQGCKNLEVVYLVPHLDASACATALHAPAPHLADQVGPLPVVAIRNNMSRQKAEIR